MARFESRTGSGTGNEVRSQQVRTARTANRNRLDTGVFRLLLPDGRLNLAKAQDQAAIQRDGVAISRSIVDSDGGRLWATANDGRGATFYFTCRPQFDGVGPGRLRRCLPTPFANIEGWLTAPAHLSTSVAQNTPGFLSGRG